MEQNESKTVSENESADVVEVAQPADGKRNEEEDSKALELIRTRFEGKDFPSVHPQEDLAEELSSAVARGDLLRQQQHVYIQSYIDKKYTVCRELVSQDEVPEILMTGRWARESYYVHVKEMLAQMKKEDADFVSDVLPADLDLTRQAEGTTTL